MPRLRFDSTGRLISADTPKEKRRPARHLDPKRAWRSSFRWQKLRAEHLKRQPVCVHCGTTQNLTVDHIRSVRAGGDRWDPANLQTLCNEANSSKGAK
jgi:5-methylcytosine-specific restriction endonuclease McrA